MQHSKDNSSANAGISERLHAIESSLRMVTGSQAGDVVGNEVISRAVNDLASLRAELSSSEDAKGVSETGTSPKSATQGKAQDPGSPGGSLNAAPEASLHTPPDASLHAGPDASLNAAVDHERIKRAASEIKSGEFDVQG